MRKIAIGILAMTLIFLTVQGGYAQPPVSIDLDILYGGGVMTDGGDSIYFGLRALNIQVDVRGELRVEKSGGNLIVVSQEGPVLTCRVQDAAIECGDISTLTCEDGTEVTVNDVEDTLSFNGGQYYLEHGIIECREISRP